MEPGRELDALVAEKVFGYTLDYEFADLNFGGAPCVKELRDQYDEWGLLPPYSVDMSDAWRVLEYMLEHAYTSTVWMCLPGVTCRIESGGIVMAQIEARTAPHAICLAALKAIGQLKS